MSLDDRTLAAIEAKWSVRCPTCTADVDEPCVTVNGHRVGLHAARRRAVDRKIDAQIAAGAELQFTRPKPPVITRGRGI